MGSSLFGHAVDSELPLGRLTDAPTPRGTLRLVRADRPLLDDTGELVAWLETEQPGLWVALARSPAGLLGFWSDTGAFLVEPGSRRVQAQPSNGAGEVWQHRMLSSAIPLLLSELGDLVLHAAGLALPSGAVLLCGPSGRGKSTLALRLASERRRVLGEDGVAVSFERGRPVAWPGPRGIRLAGADGAPKRLHPVPAGLRAGASAPVIAVVSLGPRTPGRLEVERLDPVTGARALVSSVLCAPGAGLARALSLAARLAESVPVYRARMPEGLSRVAPAGRELLQRVERYAARGSESADNASGATKVVRPGSGT
jgi:hypothetical protein